MSDQHDTEAEPQTVRDLHGTQIVTRSVLGSEVAMGRSGGVDYAKMSDMVDTAKLLAKAGPMLPPWLQDNAGGMFAICMRAQELGISPLTLANWTYVVKNNNVERVAYESQYFHALVEKYAPLEERLRYEILGEGDERRCRVWGTIIGEREPRSFTSDTLKNLRPARNEYGKIKGSPLWDTKPELQLFYNASRDFARVWFPDVIGGMYGRDEMLDHGGTEVRPAITNTIADRLPAVAGAGGFDANGIARTLGEAPVEQEKPAATQEPATAERASKPRKAAQKAAPEPAKPVTDEYLAGIQEKNFALHEPATAPDYIAWAERWIGNLSDADYGEQRWEGERDLRTTCKVSVTDRKRIEKLLQAKITELKKG